MLSNGLTTGEQRPSRLDFFKSRWLGLMIKIVYGSTFAVFWAWLARSLFLAVDQLWAAAVFGDQAEALLAGLLTIWGLFWGQSLFFVPRFDRPWEVFIGVHGPASPLVFLLLPFRLELKTGPTWPVVACPEDQTAMEAAIKKHLNCPLSARLALLLNSQTPLDCLARKLITSPWPIIPRLANLLYLITSPVRLFLRLWGYGF